MSYLLLGSIFCWLPISYTHHTCAPRKFHVFRGPIEGSLLWAHSKVEVTRITSEARTQAKEG